MRSRRGRARRAASVLHHLEIHYTRLNSDSYEPQNVVAPSSLGFSISPQNTASQSVPNISLLGIAIFATGAPFDILCRSNSGSTGNSVWCSPATSYYNCPDVPQQVAPIVRPDIRTMIVNPTTGTSTNRTAFFKTPGLFPGTSPQLRGGTDRHLWKH